MIILFRLFIALLRRKETDDLKATMDIGKLINSCDKQTIELLTPIIQKYAEELTVEKYLAFYKEVKALVNDKRG